ncbi:hypothetical protein K438DRAFT_1998324 [Mycena galopus ATCC 62051]|nr:hypothetical protein K438DRAFT_1998324 [Mycena galopus ATCC 62051]
MTSPFASKLGTNYCPLDKEVLEIQALLGDPLSRLQSLDNRIAELQKAIIDELAEERAMGLAKVTEEHVPRLQVLAISEIPVPQQLHDPIVQWGSFGLLRGRNLSSFTFFGTNTFSRSNIDPQGFPLRWDELVTLCITVYQRATRFGDQ